MKPRDFNLKKTSADTFEGSPCENVEVKLLKISENNWHIFIRNNNPGIKFPSIGTVAKSWDDALDFLDNYEGCGYE